MNSLLRIIAYICIGTTPIQVCLVFWGLWIVNTTDLDLLSLSHIEFFRNYLTIFLPIVDWLYAWLWNPYLDFIFSLPIVIAQTFKAIISTWLGFWILKKIR
ncbi:hypothetical protein N9A24_04495 [Gammaproteobacteria bacterium]|nr:hypothetical protein [Gammaproteobacteria bacterium]MDC1525024.1 hypothetical protein [Gammaproteobacteria bacterium]